MAKRAARVRSADDLAIRGGRPAISIPAPAWPVSGDLEAAWMEAVVRSGKWSWIGPHETAFSKEFADFIGARHCLCLSNGTVTLQCALQAVGVVPGDEVIVPGLTWVATAQAALDVGADVVFVDIDPATLCIDPKAIEKAITPRTRAVVPVHMYGCMCDMDAIMEIARRRSVKVVEDTAHQHGSRWRNKGAGAIGDVGSFSFQQSKILTCGEGGAVTTNDDEVYAAVHAMKHVGWTPDMTPAGRYGHNYRITEMQAVLLRGGMTRIAEQTRLREENALAIEEGLKEIGGPLRVVGRDPRVTRQAYYCLTLHYDPAKAGGIPKSAYFAALTAEGCPILPTYPPVYRAPLLNLYHSTSPVPYRDKTRIQDYANLRLPNIERAVGQTAGVMWHPHLLGSPEYTGQLLAAFHKVADNLPKVKKTWREAESRKAAD